MLIVVSTFAESLISTSIATVGPILVALSLMMGSSAQALLFESIVLIFIKHPCDVGRPDRVCQVDVHRARDGWMGEGLVETQRMDSFGRTITVPNKTMNNHETPSPTNSLGAPATLPPC